MLQLALIAFLSAAGLSNAFAEPVGSTSEEWLCAEQVRALGNQAQTIAEGALDYDWAARLFVPPGAAGRAPKETRLILLALENRDWERVSDMAQRLLRANADSLPGIYLNSLVGLHRGDVNAYVVGASRVLGYAIPDAYFNVQRAMPYLASSVGSRCGRFDLYQRQGIRPKQVPNRLVEPFERHEFRFLDACGRDGLLEPLEPEATRAISTGLLDPEGIQAELDPPELDKELAQSVSKKAEQLAASGSYRPKPFMRHNWPEGDLKVLQDVFEDGEPESLRATAEILLESDPTNPIGLYIKMHDEYWFLNWNKSLGFAELLLSSVTDYKVAEMQEIMPMVGERIQDFVRLVERFSRIGVTYPLAHARGGAIQRHVAVYFFHACVESGYLSEKAAAYLEQEHAAMEERGETARTPNRRCPSPGWSNPEVFHTVRRLWFLKCFDELEMSASERLETAPHDIRALYVLVMAMAAQIESTQDNARVVPLAQELLERLEL